jgi:hypothetical protein
VSQVAARHSSGVRRPRTGEAVATLLVLLGLAYAFASAATHGQSWDDPGDAAFGRAYLRAYVGGT